MTNAEIQVGEYVRTKYGRIGKIISKKPVYENDKLDYYLYLTSLNEFFYTEKQIKECGWRIEKNLIDLIEVGDFVNGHKVFGFCKVGDTRCYLHVDDYECSGLGRSIYPEDIQTLVTREQFKASEYVLGGKEE